MKRRSFRNFESAEQDMRRYLLATLLAVLTTFVSVLCAADPNASAPTLKQAEAVLSRLADEGRGKRTGERIRAAIANLGHREFKVRERAVRDLRTIGHRAIPGLRQALNGEDFEIRTRAAELLETFEDLPARLPAELRQAIRVLRHQPATIIPLLGELLDHPNPTVQHVAIHELRRQSGTQFGFSIHLEEKRKQEAIKRWSDWIEAGKANDRQPLPPTTALLVNTYDQGTLSAYAFDAFPVPDQKDATPKPIWTRPVPGRIAFAIVHDKQGTQELLLSNLADKTLRGVDAAFTEQWTWKIPPKDPAATASAKGSVYGIHPLPDGELLLGIGYSPEHAVIKLSARRDIIDSVAPPLWQPSCVVTLPLPQTEDRLILPFERANRLVAFDQYGAVKWNRDFTSPRRVRRLPSGHLLLATRDAVLELSPTGETLWEHECHDALDALRLPDGRTAVLLAFEGLVLIDIDHSETKTIDRDLRYGSLSLIPPGPFTQRRD